MQNHPNLSIQIESAVAKFGDDHLLRKILLLGPPSFPSDQCESDFIVWLTRLSCGSCYVINNPIFMVLLVIWAE